MNFLWIILFFKGIPRDKVNELMRKVKDIEGEEVNEYSIK